MILGHPQICLYQPEIPQNTGSIGRLCAGSGSRLHLIEPFGFDVSDKQLRRAGLDYWPFLDLEIHANLDDLLKLFTDPTSGSLQKRVAFLSKKADRLYTEIPASVDLLVFGRETSGLPDTLAQAFPEAFYRIPMYHPGVRSQNLANAVSIVLYDRLARVIRADECE